MELNKKSMHVKIGMFIEYIYIYIYGEFVQITFVSIQMCSIRDTKFVLVN